MPPIKVRNRKTGQVVLINWDSPRPPSGEEIALATRQQNEPPRGMEPPRVPKASGPLFEPGAAPTPDATAGHVGSAPARTKAGLGELEIPSLGSAIRSVAARGIGSALNTPISERLGGAQHIERQFGQEVDLGTSPEAAAGTMLARHLSPAHVAAAVSLPARSAISAAGNAPLAVGGAARMVDPEASGWERAGGGLEAALSLLGLRGIMPTRAAKPGYSGGVGKAKVEQFGRVPDTLPLDTMPTGVRQVQGAPAPPPPSSPQINLPLEAPGSGRIPYGAVEPPPYRAAAKAGIRQEEQAAKTAAREAEKKAKEAAKQLENQEALNRIERRIEKAGLTPQGTSISQSTSAKTGAAGESVRMTTKIGKAKEKKGAAGKSQMPPDAPPAVPVSAVPEPPAPVPGAAGAAEGLNLGGFSPDLRAALDELQITPEQAAKLAPEDLVGLVRGLRAQLDASPTPGTVGEAVAKAGVDIESVPISQADLAAPNRLDLSPSQAKAVEDLEKVQDVSGGAGARAAIGGRGTFVEPSLPAPVKPGLGGARSLMSPEDAAEQMGVSTKTIMRALRSGSLQGSKVGRQWRIAAEDLEKMGSGKGRGPAVGVGPTDVTPGSATGSANLRQTGPVSEGGRRPKIDAIIRGDEQLAEAFSGLTREQRAAVYREFAGRSKDLTPDQLPSLLDEVVKGAREGTLPGQKGGGKGTTLTAGIDPTMLGQAWKYPAARAAIGGATGYNLGDDDAGAYGNRYTMGLLGALAGVGAAPRAYKGIGLGSPTDMRKGLDESMRWVDRAQYESMLAGPAQLQNVGGGATTLLTTPALELSRGNVAQAQRLAKALVQGDTWQSAKAGLKQGWNDTTTRMKHSGELPLGPSGRALNAGDRATKNVLKKGGLSEEMAGHYTFTEDPVTDLGKSLQMLQQKSRLFKTLTPFIRTRMKQLELAAAHSPLRIASPALQKTFPVAGGDKWSNPYFYTSMMPGPAAAVAGYYSLDAVTPTMAALLGGLAAPYEVGQSYQDYKKHGQGGVNEAARAVSRMIPVIGDSMRTVEGIEQFPGRIAGRFVPPALYAVGDKTVRDPRGEGALDVEGYLKDRMPWEREALPARPNFFGEPDQRTWYGSAPAPLYTRDPRAAQLAEMDLLRYRQSPQMGQAELSRPEVNELQTHRGQMMMKLLEPFLQNPQMIAGMPDTVAEALAQIPEDQREELEELIPSGAFITKEDVYRFIQQQGINAGTNQFKARRLVRQLGGEQ